MQHHHLVKYKTIVTRSGKNREQGMVEDQLYRMSMNEWPKIKGR
jgi:hypothetical protein